MDTVTPEPQTQQEPLKRRLTKAVGLGERDIDVDVVFAVQCAYLFPVLNRNGASIYIGWGTEGYVSVDIHEMGIRDYVVHEYSFEGDLAAAASRALERYWGLE